ncbi:MAG: hypothetical protein ACRCV9_05855 [Burkholderiaceae bacterium]
MKFDTHKATNFALANAWPKYDVETCGNCGLAVRKAINAGGILGKFGHGFQFATSLPTAGFQRIPLAGYKPELGDIAVFGRTSRLPHGHVQIWCGAQWVSDYVQRGIGDHGGIYPSKTWLKSELTVWRHSNVG